MKKINVLVISGIVAIILFVLLTILQSKIIKQEATVSVYISNVDINRDESINKTDYREVNVPASVVLNTDAITNYKDIEGKYRVT